MYSKSIKHKSAFSLIELSMALIIISILLTISVSVSKTAISNNKTADTKNKIEEIYQALGNFVKKHGRLPCPAAINLNESNANYGIEASSCNSAPSSGSGYYKSLSESNLYYGMIPIRTIGLPKESSLDGFGTKFAYIVINGFTNSQKFDQDLSGLNGNYVNSSGSNKIFIKENNGSASTINDEAIFVVVSYGENKNSGWNKNSSSQNTRSNDADERENDITSIDSSAGNASFDYIFYLSSNNNDNFDDIILYKTRAQLLTDFSYNPSKPCSQNITQKVTYGSEVVTHYWAGTNSINQGDAVASAVPCPSGYTAGVSAPTKKCGEFKRWNKDIATACTPN